MRCQYSGAFEELFPVTRSDDVGECTVLLFNTLVDGDFFWPFPRALDDRVVLLVDILPPFDQIRIRCQSRNASVML
jgi:hypothetical protein